MKDKRPRLHYKNRRRLARLERRLEHLEDVIELGEVSAGSLGHYEADHAALDWAIDVIYEHYELDKERQRP